MDGDPYFLAGHQSRNVRCTCGKRATCTNIEGEPRCVPCASSEGKGVYVTAAGVNE